VKRFLVIALALAAAGGAWAGLGSVISSFSYSSPIGGSALALYVENGYVYFVGDNGLSYPNRLCCTFRYTTAGSYVGSSPLGLVPNFPSVGPCSCEASHLGAGYMYIMADNYYSAPANDSGVFDLAAGYYVSGPQIDFIGAYRDIAWDGQYYYIHDWNSPPVFYRTTVGGAMSSFIVSNFYDTHVWGLAYAHAVGGVAGRYLIAGPPYPSGSTGCYVDLDTNSVAGTITLPFGGSATCAPGYPSSYGETLWISDGPLEVGHNCYQIDLGNSGVVNLTPASLGRIKAVYR
jgi:hypothetical protein